MRIAIYQTKGHSGEPAANLDLAETVAAAAGKAGIDLLVFPELFLTGYNIGEATGALAQAADGPAARRMAAIARRQGVAMIYGYPERDGDALYNSALLVDARGECPLNYRKTHLFGERERAIFRAGEEACALADVAGRRVGVLICYDVEFPECARLLALSGAELIVVPTALMEPYDDLPIRLVPARAYENQVFVAYANRCGREGDLVYVGNSLIAAPDGTIAARTGQAEGLVVAEVDWDAYAHSRAQNTYLADRRPRLYGALADPGVGDR